MVYEQEHPYSPIEDYYFYQQPIHIPQYYHPAQLQTTIPDYHYYDDRAYYYPTHRGTYPQTTSTYLMPPTSEASPENRMVQQFLDANGQVDIQKMLKTIAQFADTVQQVSPVIKQINDLIRNFRN